ncbi:MAG TPA: GNAT family N-acetyltransferase [Ardenticatenaceae bacterium]
MIHALPRDGHEKARALFLGPHLELVIDAVIAGNHAGTIWVDDLAHPSTALMWDHSYSYYLAGAADDAEVNEALARLVTERLFPEARARQIGVFKVYAASGEWEQTLEMLFPNRSLVRRWRVFYTFSCLKVPDWRKRVPDGFSVRRIDRETLEASALKNVAAVTEEIELMWNSVEAFLRRGFGFWMVAGDEIVCWCTAEYASAGKCGIGIETVEAHQMRGFATLTAAAFAEHCVAEGITPHWEAWRANAPSVAVAEKVGFEKTVEFAVYVGRIGPA